MGKAVSEVKQPTVERMETIHHLRRHGAGKYYSPHSNPS